MSAASLGFIIGRVIYLYTILIIVYVLMSWIPVKGALYDIYRALGTVVEPYLRLFRRIIPPIGMIDISPIVAVIALNLLARLLLLVL